MGPGGPIVYSCSSGADAMPVSCIADHDTLYLALICCVPPCPSVRLPFTWVRSRSGHCVYETQCARGKICDDTQFSSLKKEFLRRGSFVVAGAQFCCAAVEQHRPSAVAAGGDAVKGGAGHASGGS